MIAHAEAFSVFRKWQDEGLLLRVDARLGVMSFSFECFVSRVEEPLIGLLLTDCGFIEFVFDNTWAFDFTAPDAARAEMAERFGVAPLGKREYEF